MIRIDEIYDNTFLPIIKTKHNHSLSWFDPFGTVGFDNLRSMPPLFGKEGLTRYLCWDQEPLHKELVDQTLSQYSNIYLGSRYLITSEKDSEFVKYACETYDFKPLYYFFHGWAALDWYRGYNRSHVMLPPSKRTITKTFIMPNRIVGGARQHRLIMLYHIFKNKLTNNWISCPAVCPAENISVTDAARTLEKTYPDITEVFANQQLPLSFPNESDAPMHSCWLSLFDECADSLLYLVSETVASGQRLHLTEKTFKPICLRMPFIIIGTKGSLAYLRSYGFKTFGDLWDESYDDEVHDIQRIEKISWVLRGLDSATTEEKQRLFNLAQEVCEYNYNHFYNGGFEEILWKELNDMLEVVDV